MHADPKAPAPAGSTVGGYGGLTTAVCSTCQHMRNRTEPTDPQPYGGISFMEYFLGGSFFSSFGWIGPRFFPKSAALSAVEDGGALLRRSRGPRTQEEGVVLPQHVLVDSESGAVKSRMSGCIPGYACGGDRVFYQEGPEVLSAPAPGTHAWVSLENGTLNGTAALEL